jgi:hypothetical protein
MGDHSFLLQSPWEFFFPEIPESRLLFLGRGDMVAGLNWLTRRCVPVRAEKS